jgi:hypothetical protein
VIPGTTKEKPLPTTVLDLRRFKDEGHRFVIDGDSARLHKRPVDKVPARMSLTGEGAIERVWVPNVGQHRLAGFLLV